MILSKHVDSVLSNPTLHNVATETSEENNEEKETCGKSIEPTKTSGESTKIRGDNINALKFSGVRNVPREESENQGKVSEVNKNTNGEKSRENEGMERRENNACHFKTDVHMGHVQRRVDTI